MRMSRLVNFTCSLLLAACSSLPAPVDSGSSPSDAGSDASSSPDAGVATVDAMQPGAISFGTPERPAAFVLPPAHDGTTPLPLVILLHGYSASAALQDAYMMTSALARARGFYL